MEYNSKHPFSKYSNRAQKDSTKQEMNMAKLATLLQNDKTLKTNEAWCKLSKTNKLQKLKEYIQLYKTTVLNGTIDDDRLLDFFRDCLDKKKLMKEKDVVYNRETGIITNITSLMVNTDGSFALSV